MKFLRKRYIHEIEATEYSYTAYMKLSRTPRSCQNYSFKRDASRNSFITDGKNPQVMINTSKSTLRSGVTDHPHPNVQLMKPCVNIVLNKITIFLV